MKRHSVYFFIQKKVKTNVAGEVPIYLRITIDGIKSNISTKEQLSL